MNLTEKEARRLHEEAGAMTKAELRKFNKLYGGGEWLSNVDKKFMVREFQKLLEKKVMEFAVADLFPGRRKST